MPPTNVAICPTACPALNRVVGGGRSNLRLKRRFPMRQSVERRARAVVCLLRPSHLETVCRQFEDGVDLHGDHLVFGLFEGIMREVVGVEVFSRGICLPRLSRAPACH